MVAEKVVPGVVRVAMEEPGAERVAMEALVGEIVCQETSCTRSRTIQRIQSRWKVASHCIPGRVTGGEVNGIHKGVV